MKILHFTPTVTYGPFKPLNAVNGGPWCNRKSAWQKRSNFADYKAARIPYTRNHDANLCGSVYGGPYTVDITAIFPRFDADPYDPGSYDFACTDESVLVPLEAGTKTFYRLGQSIEHQVKKHGTVPPADFGKWAVICEHIIRHYTEGWADGFDAGIEYWEIWNEPSNPDGQTCWGGTKEQFFDLYTVTAKHLKACFPSLKIGGPASMFHLDWAGEFLDHLKANDVPLDFFSWHAYCIEPTEVADCARTMRRLLDSHGFAGVESILDEWNYVKDWGDDFVKSLITIGSEKGAAFTLGSMCECQKAPVDMLIYYDARPSVFCGLFDYYTYLPRKGYYPFLWYGAMYDALEIRCAESEKNLYTLAGIKDDGKLLAIFVNYSDDDTAGEITVKPDFGRSVRFEIFTVSRDCSGEKVAEETDPVITLPLNSMVFLKEKEASSFLCS